MLQVKANRRNYWVLRRSFQTLIVNNVQRTAGLQNIVLPDIYYREREGAGGGTINFFG